MHPVVEGAVVPAVFGKDARVDQRVIKGGVEPGSLAIRGAFDFETVQFFGPCGVELRAHRFEIPVRDLAPEIRAGLIDAQERCAGPGFHQIAGAKFGERSPARGCVRVLEAVSPAALRGAAELNGEVAFEFGSLSGPRWASMRCGS